MENQKSSQKQIMVNYGLTLGFVSILISLGNYAFGNMYKPHWAVNVIGMVALIAFIVIGIKKVKENNGGLLSLGEAFKTGLGVALLGAVLFCVYFFIFVNFIEPDFFENALVIQREVMMETYPNMSDEQLENALETAAKFSGMGVTLGMVLIWNLFLGFVISLIAGLIMKKTEEF